MKSVLNGLVGALVEAWGEVKVQKARVVLSLIGVVAAVAAMATVMALGDLIVQSETEMQEAYSGRDVTLRLTPSQTSTSDESPGGGVSSGGSVTTYSDGTPVLSGNGASPSADGSGNASSDDEGWSSQATGVVNDPTGQAMMVLADRIGIPYWSREESGSLPLQELQEISNQGTFKGVPVSVPEYQQPSTAQVEAVDTDYQALFRLRMKQGRWLRPGDVNQRVTPVVINQSMWEMFGAPNVDDPLTLTTSEKTPQQVRVVGVTPGSSYEPPTMYVLYDSWQLMKPAEGDATTGAAAGTGMSSGSGAHPSMLVWADPSQADEARTVLPSALGAVLGKGWTVSVSGGENFDSGQDQLAALRIGIMAIGGIVVFLGALGLLNVAIVTVRQRIREIGIRRAMGATAKRVFFSVFMESVVATFVAGLIGVGLAILIVRFLPLEAMDIYLQDRPPFPVSAAAAGVGIATSVGALCGIIPALAAVRVRPIDAIRY